MPCGITVTQDTTPLEIASPAILDWWACQNGDLTSWAEPWVVSICVQLPAARYHSAYQRINTLVGPKWQRHISSEGFSLNMGSFVLTLNASSEQIFTDPTIVGYYYTPTYGRKLDLTVNNSYGPGGAFTKSTFISTSDSSANTNCWIILDLMYQPYTSTLSVYGNGKFLLNAPISPAAAGSLLLASFDLKPTPISDPIGEISLTKPWPDDGVTLPSYTVVPHTAVGYPTSFVSESPVIGFIDIHRGATSLPFHQETVDPIACSYIGAPLISITGLQASLVPMFTATHGNTFFIEATSDTLDSGNCGIWWDTINNGSILLGNVSMSKGFISAGLSTNTPGFGWIRIVNNTFNMGTGASYLTKNPMPLVIV